MDVIQGDEIYALVRTGFFRYRRTLCRVTQVPTHDPKIVQVSPMIKNHRGRKWINLDLQFIAHHDGLDRA